MAANGESSPGDLSSPPSRSPSEPASPSRNNGAVRRARDIGDIIVGNSPSHQAMSGSEQPSHSLTPQPSAGAESSSGTRKPPNYGWHEGKLVPLTAAGVPRKKPGRKPGTTVKPRTSDVSDANPDQPAKVRKPRKPRDPDAPPAQRKRKLAPTSAMDIDSPGATASSASAPPSSFVQGGASSHDNQSPFSSANVSRPLSPLPTHQNQQQPTSDHRFSPKMPKREGGYMQSILNAEPPARPASASQSPNSMLKRSSGQSFDPIRGSYDPVRETMMSRDPYGSSTGSPGRPTSQNPNRSPSIASLIEPAGARVVSPSQTHGYQPTSSRLQAPESKSMPPSPSHPARSTPASQAPSKTPTAAQEAKKDIAPPPPPAPRPVPKESNFTTIANGPVRKPVISGVSTPKTDTMDDAPQEGDGRSILDFGKANPGEEVQAPTIILNIPIVPGEVNKYVNFTRMAEERYGWDALHPKLAANRDRKVRIAAAAASLEKTESGRESGDEMSVDLSDAENSNQENGATSGVDAQAKPKKKRNFKEDQYDVDDDFVDDSETLWEAQAAASRDGFFVYSGPLVQEEEKPPTPAPTRRGRGGGRGSRGGRTASTRGTSTSTRGGGPGSRGGMTRKPRITKSEKLQRQREKEERENMALNRSNSNAYVVQPPTPSLAVGELGA